LQYRTFCAPDSILRIVRAEYDIISEPTINTDLLKDDSDNEALVINILLNFFSIINIKDCLRH